MTSTAYDLHPAFIRRMRGDLRSRTRSLPETVAEFIHAGHEGRIGIPLEHTTSPVAYANRWAHQEIDALRAANIHKAYDEAAIRDIASNRSRIAGKLPAGARARFCAGNGIAPPGDRGTSAAGRSARMACPKWWRRRIRHTFTRSAEDAVRRIGMIRRGRSPYISDHAVYHRRDRQQRMRKYLESHHLENEIGEQLPLFSVAESLSPIRSSAARN